jgi:hypothetical protein
LCSSSKDHRSFRRIASSSRDKGRCQYMKACTRECLTARCRLPSYRWRPLRTPVPHMDGKKYLVMSPR